MQYFKSYLSEVQRAMATGVDVRGYFAWSLLDNFEWADGFSKRFGLFRVNFTDPERHRAPKSSAFFYRDYIQRPSSAFTMSRISRRKQNGEEGQGQGLGLGQPSGEEKSGKEERIFLTDSTRLPPTS